MSFCNTKNKHFWYSDDDISENQVLLKNLHFILMNSKEYIYILHEAVWILKVHITSWFQIYKIYADPCQKGTPLI